MSNKFFKKAQTGETLTWIVATVAIVVILYISILIAGGQDTLKKAAGLDKEVIYKDIRQGEKSLHGVLLSEKGRVYYSIRDNGNLVEKGDFVKKVFESIYSDEYEIVWFGVLDYSDTLSSKSNDYFGTRIIPEAKGSGIFDRKKESSNTVFLINDNYAELFLGGEE